MKKSGLPCPLPLAESMWFWRMMRLLQDNVVAIVVAIVVVVVLVFVDHHDDHGSSIQQVIGLIRSL
jgi:hypothetical protein